MSEFDQLQVRKLDGGLLLVFRELLARRRASEVAAQLGLSPSAISHALGRLRDLFGEQLFVRRSHGLEPTQRALELAPKIEALIELIGQTVSTEQGFDPASARRRFRIACQGSIASLIGGHLTGTFRRFAPGCAFSIRPAMFDRALRAVRRGEVDVALGAFRQIPQGLAAAPLFEDDYVVIARKGHPQADGAIDMAAYALGGHIFVGDPDGALTDETPVDRETIEGTYGGMPGPGEVWTHAYVSQWETAMLLVSTTNAMADCPRSLARRFAGPLGLQVLEPPFGRFRFTVQAVRRANAADPGLDWFMGRVAEAAAT
ncbi:MAG TPA: LysR substrate-binding domain-containing protein [Caulobacteraceae bacterium]|nr:LysR substrate-binding domain-containing protein [Caulobacteraceae bacterium]